MRTHVLGDGDPEIAVVAGVHGDEPCGPAAVERLLADPPDLVRPVKVVVANEAAVERGVRFLDTDLNRAFPGDPEADAHESRLAARLADELAGCVVLDLHSTVSTSEPFALVTEVTDRTSSLARATGVDNVVDISHVGGGLTDVAPGVAVECGRKGTAAAVETAHRVVESFLSGVGAVAGDADPPRREPTLYRVNGVEPGVGYEFVGENFRRVEAGETFARRGDEGKRAADAFYPVLMSTDGYDDLVGFRARRVGPLGRTARLLRSCSPPPRLPPPP